jgi:hypothetical protein
MRVTAVVAVLSILPAGSPRGQDAGNQPEPINDGPYLYRYNDTTIIALYLCSDTLVVDTTYLGGDTFRIKGLCFDSGNDYSVPVSGFGVKPDEFSGVSRVLSVSDIHGEYEFLCSLLVNSGVVGSDLHWIWGDGHLVVIGDTFDRGDRVTECLWLLYRLEQEAALSGGDVHVLLGNHEEMVIRGDDRYIHDKYIKGIARKVRIDHRDLYGSNMVLGQWLRTKHTAIRINDVLYVHAGLPPSFADSGLTLSEVNSAVRQYLGINSVRYRFDKEARLMLGGSGPLWYRGLWWAEEGWYAKTSDADIDRILDFYDVSAMVVGHTNMDSVMSYYGGKVFAVDVLVEDLGSLQALLWQDSAFYRVTGEGILVRLE